MPHSEEQWLLNKIKFVHIYIIQYGKHQALNWLKKVHTHTHTHKPLCKHEDVTVSLNQRVNTQREVTTIRAGVIIRSKKR